VELSFLLQNQMAFSMESLKRRGQMEELRGPKPGEEAIRDSGFDCCLHARKKVSVLE
jgi:hypothetical protein